MRQAIARALARQSAGSTVALIVLIALIALVVGLPSLGSGFFLDDYAHQAALRGVGPLAAVMGEGTKLYSFATGEAEQTNAIVASGFYPWWTDENLQLAFWRPVAAASHQLDHWLWPEHALPMHGHSVVWYVLAALLAVVLYREVGRICAAAEAERSEAPGGLRQAGPRFKALAGLSALFFVVDETHALPVVWLANRNALLGLVFALMAAWAHLRWRQSTAGGRTATLATAPRSAAIGASGSLVWLAVSLGALLLALLANEGSVGVLGLYVAAAFWLERGAIVPRVLGVSPALLVVGVWRLVYQQLGYGASGSPSYLDPGAEPLRFIAAAVSRVPVLLTGLFTNLPVLPYGLLSTRAKVVVWVGSTLVLLGLAWLLLRLSRRSAASGVWLAFWLSATVLAVLPAAATLPSGRLLGVASIGASAVLAWVLERSWALVAAPALRWRVLASTVVAAHLVMAPVAFLAAGQLLRLASRAMEEQYRSIQYETEPSAQIQFIVDAPTYFTSSYAMVFRQLRELPTPHRSHTLSPNDPRGASIAVTRLDERTLRYEPSGGFPYLLFRRASSPEKPEKPEMPGKSEKSGSRLEVGQRIDLDGLTVEVERVNDRGEVQSVLYRFDEPLESSRYVWKRSEGIFGLADFEPPRVGESTQLGRAPRD